MSNGPNSPGGTDQGAFAEEADALLQSQLGLAEATDAATAAQQNQNAEMADGSSTMKTYAAAAFGVGAAMGAMDNAMGQAARTAATFFQEAAKATIQQTNLFTNSVVNKFVC